MTPGDLHTVGAVARRSFVLEKTCHEDAGHSHRYDHTTRIRTGSVRVFFGDGTTESHSEDYAAGESFLVRAEVHHRIKALADGTEYDCEFAHRDFDGNIVQRYNGNLTAYG